MVSGFKTLFKNALLEEGIEKDVASVVTQVVVDKNDPALSTSANQSVHSTQKKKQKQKLKNQVQLSKKMLVVAGVKLLLHQNQWISKKSIPSVPLLNDGQVVVAAGGGGIPVVKEANGSLTGVEAVIDKRLCITTFG